MSSQKRQKIMALALALAFVALFMALASNIIIINHHRHVYRTFDGYVGVVAPTTFAGGNVVDVVARQ